LIWLGEMERRWVACAQEVGLVDRIDGVGRWCVWECVEWQSLLKRFLAGEQHRLWAGI
jgi:hypothetical protein